MSSVKSVSHERHEFVHVKSDDEDEKEKKKKRDYEGDKKLKSNSLKAFSKYHVTKIEEKVHLTQKFKIKSAIDPSNGREYSLEKMLESGLIDNSTSMFYVPSTGQVLGLDEAIRSGIVVADLIDEFLETSNESFEYIQQNTSCVNEYKVDFKKSIVSW